MKKIIFILLLIGVAIHFNVVSVGTIKSIFGKTIDVTGKVVTAGVDVGKKVVAEAK
jgi:hypothetical protein